MYIDNIENPLWNKKICIKPWTDAFCTPWSVAICCYNTFMYDKKYDTIYDKNSPYGNNIDFWNSEKFVKLRKKMLEGGSALACPNILCEMNTNPAHNMFISVREFGYTLTQSSLNKVIESIQKGKTVLDYHPPKAVITITDSCDCNCAFCEQNLRRNTNSIPEIPEDAENSTINFLNKCDSVMLVGGEIMNLPPDILKKYMKNIVGVNNVSIMTNGKKLDLENYELICVNGPITHVLVSLNTSNKREYTEGKVRENIHAFEKNLSSIYSKYENHKIFTFTVVVTTSVLPFLEEIIEMAHKYNVKVVQFFPLQPKAMIELGLSIEDMCGEGYTEEIYERYDKYSKLAKQTAKKLNIITSGFPNFDESFNKKRASLL